MENQELFKHLDVECYNCKGNGIVYAGPHCEPCDICSGTGCQPTRAGIELLNFLRRQRKRIERESIWAELK